MRREGSWQYEVRVLKDDTAVAQVPVEVDWEPLCEALRFDALRVSGAPDEALVADCSLEPLWDPERGAPYLTGIRGGVSADGSSVINRDFSTTYLSDTARAVVEGLVQQGVLATGDEVRCIPVALPLPCLPDGPRARRLGTRRSSTTAIRAASLTMRLARATYVPPTLDDARGEDLPVFVPRQVIDEALTLTKQSEGIETGGVLLGHLCRDGSDGQLFLEVTAQLPAQHTDADATRLTFTSKTWAAVRAASQLRGRGELMLGWHHSHPVRVWCRDCSVERQRACSMRPATL